MFEMTPFGRKSNSIFDYFDQFDKAFFSGFNGNVPFKTDILETPAAYQLQAELPGFQKGDIKIDISGGKLTIQAEHTEQSEEKKNGAYLRRERSCGVFARSFDLSGVDETGITAAYENGVLTLNLPKKPEKTPAVRQVEVR